MNRGTTARSGDRPHHLLALDLGKVDDLAAVEYAEIHRFTRLFHHAPHIGAGNCDNVARAHEHRADPESLDTDGPGGALIVEPDVAFVLERGQQAVGGGIRQADLMGTSLNDKP